MGFLAGRRSEITPHEASHVRNEPGTVTLIDTVRGGSIKTRAVFWSSVLAWAAVSETVGILSISLVTITF